MDFFIDGAVSYIDSAHPTITGGTKIGLTAGTFLSITEFTGSATLSAGQHTAYMVLLDYGGETGALIGPSTFGQDPNTVPEPSTYALLCISLGVVGFVRKKMVKSKV